MTGHVVAGNTFDVYAHGQAVKLRGEVFPN